MKSGLTAHQALGNEVEKTAKMRGFPITNYSTLQGVYYEYIHMQYLGKL